MTLEAAFLSPQADDLFESVAAFANATELEKLDVTSGQSAARKALGRAIENAARRRPSPATRIALIKGEAGSGKTHVLTTIFKKAAAIPVAEFYPAVLQLTAPVGTADYEKWLLDASFRELMARHFPDHFNQSPLKRLAEHLLDHIEVDERDEFMRLIDDVDDDGEIALARRFGAKLRKEASALLTEEPPSESFLGAILLAGHGDWSAVRYLRQGHIDARLQPLELPRIETPHERLMVLKDLGLAAQIIGATLAFGFDQVENTVRLGDEGLFLHTLVQVVRLAEAIPNCSVSIAVLADEYERIASSLPASDRDRIEHEDPVRLERGSVEFLQRVIAQRLAILRQRGGLAEMAGSLDPLPDWFLPRIREARSVRLALREVSLFREKGLELGRLPERSEYVGRKPPVLPGEACDYDKLWADSMDLAPAVVSQLLVPTKATLLAWWASEASREQLAGESPEVNLMAPNGTFQTHVVEIRLRATGRVVELRQLALCEAPNRSQQLSNQIEAFLDACTGVPMVLRSKGFPKGRTAQVAPALRKLDAMGGLRLDLSDTEWHILQRAKDFAEQQSNQQEFLSWRRDRQWLTQLMSPLQPLITLPSAPSPEPTGPGAQAPALEAAARPNQAQSHESRFANGAFPVLVGRDASGNAVIWDPYRDAPNHLNNFSFLVTGDAGSGKTQTIRVLIDAACKAGLSVCVFDFKADYCDSAFTDPLGIEVIDLRDRGLPFNPLQPPPRGASGIQPAEHAYELTGVLARVFKLGAVQQGHLRDAINGAYEAAGIPSREWVDPAKANWPFFDQVVTSLRENGGNAALVTKLSLFTDLHLFPNTAPPESFESFIDKRVSLKLSDLPNDEIKAALAEIIIIQLHGFALRGDQPRRLKRLLVFDEAHRVRDSARLESLAREGRAFGVGIVMGTQFPGDVPETMAGNLATQLFLMNNQAKHRSWIVRQIYGTTTGREPRELLDKLRHFRPLDGLFSNSHHQMALLRVIPHYERSAPAVEWDR